MKSADLLIAIIIQDVEGGEIKMRFQIGQNFYQVEYVDKCQQIVPKSILNQTARYLNPILMVKWENAQIAVFLEIIQQRQRFNIRWTKLRYNFKTEITNFGLPNQIIVEIKRVVFAFLKTDRQRRIKMWLQIYADQLMNPHDLKPDSKPSAPPVQPDLFNHPNTVTDQEIIEFLNKQDQLSGKQKSKPTKPKPKRQCAALDSLQLSFFKDEQDELGF